MRKLLTVIILALVSLVASNAQGRTARTINEGWTFTKEDRSVQVHLPHTWNAEDCQDDVAGYWRGECTYAKTLEFGDEIDGRRIYLRFEGAYQRTVLLVNGQSAGEHVGGYTAFVFDITDLVRKGRNDILVKVDNSHDEDIPALSADFTFFGGIYRDVELIITPDVLIAPDVYASSGVLLSTPQLCADKATVKAVTYLSNTGSERQNVVLEHTLLTPDGTLAACFQQKLKLGNNVFRQKTEQIFEVASPKLWDVDSPEVYTVTTSLYRMEGKERILLDQVTNPLGFRNCRFDPDDGFFLNGRKVKIIGTNRHQDYLGLGNALNDEFHERDIRLLKEMGGNFLRIAHYPQDPVITDECDRLGIVNSVEIPVVNRVTVSDEFRHNCVEMAREMVFQGYNHPSTIIWAYMNEVLLGPEFAKNTTDSEKKSYFDQLCSIARDIDTAMKLADPSRPTMIPCHNNPELYKETGLGDVPDLLGWNIYCGWYVGEFADFGKTMDRIHLMFPDKPLIITEYGADNDIRVHSFAGERFDYSVEYSTSYHVSYLKAIMARDYISGSNVWNLADFYSEARGYAKPHVNCKGLVTSDRIPKDSYLYYKAVLSKTPQLFISNRDWIVRGGDEGKPQPVMVYTNQNSVELSLNGNSLGSCDVKDGISVFDVAFRDGENTLVARSGDLTDALRITFHSIPADMKEFTSLNVSMGRCFFDDKRSGIVWIPVKLYEPGSWGVVGGREGRKITRRGNTPRSSLAVFDSPDDMLFQTQYRGLEAFKADVPDGQYYVYLYFCDFDFGKNDKTLIYNLGNDVIGEKASARVFGISANGTTVIPSLDISKAVGYQRPLVKKMIVDVTDGRGLTIGFHPIKGETSLSAIRIYRCY